MTIFREYGPFRGIHNSTNNLAQKQGFVLKSENIVVDHDNGDLKKRPGGIQKEALTESIGLSKHIIERSNGDSNLFIAGTKCRVKDTLAIASTVCSDFLGAALWPSKVSGDSFSSFLYSGNLYYNYGDFIYKWDNKRVGRAGRKYLMIDDGRGTEQPTPKRNFRFVLQTCDANNDVAEISVTDLEDTNAFDGAHQNIYYGYLRKDDVADFTNRYNSPWFIVDKTKPAFNVNSIYNSVTGLDFIIPAQTLGNIAIGDFVLLLSRQIKPSANFSISSDLVWRGFEVKNIVDGGSGNRTVEFKNPFGLEVFVFAQNSNTPGRTDIVSNIVCFPYFKPATGSVYNAIEFVDRNFLVTFTGHALYPVGVIDTSPAFFPDYGTITSATGILYEDPQYIRKSLPRCKHISQLNGLMFMTCPKVFSLPVLTVAEDFDYQTVAWSSENPEDPIETWGGMSAIIGVEDEGRLYCTIPNNGNLVFFKERAIYISDTPVDGVIQPQKIMGSTVGCKHPESIQECNGLLFFYSEGKGIYLYRAGMAQAQEATSGFRGMFKTISGEVKSVHDVKGSRYIVSIGSTVFVYDYLVDSWWVWTGLNFDGGAVYFEDKVVGVNSAFKLFYLEEGVLHDNFGSNTAISAYFLTQWFMAFDAETDKKLKALRVWSLNGSDKALVEVYKNYREVTDYSFTIADSTDSIDIADFSRAESGKRKFKAIAFKVSNATIDKDLKVTGWAIDYEPTGTESKNFEGAR